MNSDARTPAERVGPGLWSIPVPIPWSPLGCTLAYLIESSAGPVLVDAGWDHPDSWQALVAGLGGAGTTVADLYGVLVTHHHRDHLGLAARIREESGAWVALHPADTAVLRRLRDDQATASARRRGNPVYGETALLRRTLNRRVNGRAGDGRRRRRT